MAIKNKLVAVLLIGYSSIYYSTLFTHLFDFAKAAFA